MNEEMFRSLYRLRQIKAMREVRDNGQKQLLGWNRREGGNIK